MFGRTEVWHPVTVHFPIALLCFSTLIMMLAPLLREKHYRSALWFATVTLLAGVTGAWVSFYTGQLADGIVARKICDPTILKDHEIAAQTTCFIFTTAFLPAAYLLRAPSLKLRRITFICTIGLMSVGVFFLFRTGHSGASVVYEQGGAVKNHPTDCAD